MKVELAEILTKPLRHSDLSPGQLIEQIVAQNRGELTDTGALVIQTGEFTGRSPKDRFIVTDAITRDAVAWNEINLPIEQKYFDLLKSDILDYLNKKPAVWTRKVFAGAEPRYRIGVTAVNEYPEGNLFVSNMFIPRQGEEQVSEEDNWLVIQAPDFKADPAKHGTRQPNFAVISFGRQTILIGGTGYTGEMKKGIFSVLNFLLPHNEEVLSMHCSANVGKSGDTALFFGLSGTGKTTLSTDPERWLIGDDEHGWSEESVFNFEGGCYAKVVNLSSENEPDIYGAIRGGALLENTRFFEGTNRVDYADTSVTENTRVSYPISFVPNSLVPSVGDTPENIFFLTCDAYGVLPPISRLSAEQAMYYFLSGYTAKVAGTETGVKEPQSTFSTCFGAPFLPLSAQVYADMLGRKIAQNNVKVWMVNTGWIGGKYGVGSRIKLKYTRAMINAALSGKLDNAGYFRHSVFGLQIPLTCPGVPHELLDPEGMWADKPAYRSQALDLQRQFEENFRKFAPAVVQ